MVNRIYCSACRQHVPCPPGQKNPPAHKAGQGGSRICYGPGRGQTGGLPVRKNLPVAAKLGYAAKKSTEKKKKKKQSTRRSRSVRAISAGLPTLGKRR